MKILIIHNKYGKFSGEEAVVEAQIKLLQANDHEVITYFRSSEELENMPNAKIKAFVSAFKNPKSNKAIKNMLLNENPDVVHIHNLYPLISPAILPLIKKMGFPIVMTVHNYRLLCPSGLFFSKGEICEKCTGVSKELNCIKNNCEGSVFKSTGYALRNFWARTQKQYLQNVDMFLSLSDLQNTQLIKNGFPQNKCKILPNMYGGNLLKEPTYHEGKYIGYVGRISPEKGSDIILKLAKQLPDINFKIAGNPTSKNDNQTVLNNVEYVGFLTKEKLSEFYSNSLFTLFTSIWNETFGLSIIEAYAHKKPVIASELGASPEIIINDETGLIYRNNDVDDLKLKMESLLNNKSKIKIMGENCYLRLKENYTPETYYSKLVKVYSSVLNNKNI